MKKLVALSLALLVAIPALASAGSDDRSHGYLGVRLQRIDGGLAEALDLEEDAGVLIRQVEASSPAEGAGLQSGDIIVAVDGESVGQPNELSRAIRDMSPGDEISIEYLRDGERKSAAVTLAESSRRRLRNIEVHDLKLGKERGYLGVKLQSLEGDLGTYFGAEDGGALVSEVLEDSPAEKLGLAAGDVIVELDGRAIESPRDLHGAVGDFDEETEVEVVWLRDRKETRGKTTLEVREGLAFLPDLPFVDQHHLQRWGDFGEGHRVLIEKHMEGADVEELREELDEMRKDLDEMREELKRRADSN